MKSKSRRQSKTPVQYLNRAIHKLALPLRYLGFRTASADDVNWHINPERIRYFANTLLILLFGLLHTADGIVTYFGLKFNYADEVNPVLLFFAGTMGLGLAIFALKLLCVEFIALLYFTRRNIGSCWGTATLFSADAFYSWVVSNNILLVVGAA